MGEKIDNRCVYVIRTSLFHDSYFVHVVDAFCHIRLKSLVYIHKSIFKPCISMYTFLFLLFTILTFKGVWIHSNPHTSFKSTPRDCNPTLLKLYLLMNQIIFDHVMDAMKHHAGECIILTLGGLTSNFVWDPNHGLGFTPPQHKKLRSLHHGVVKP